MFTTLDNGGVESFLNNYYSEMDHKEIIFDFIVPNKKIGYLEEKMKRYGSNIFHIERLRSNPFEYYRSVSNIIQSGSYDIIHCHGYKSFIGLLLGKKYNCKVRIIHSHMAYVKENIIQFIMRKVILILINLYSTDKFACGIDAACWLFGKKAYDKGQVSIINNAINIDDYDFNLTNRNKIRKEFNIKENEYLLGNVGRLTDQKNQGYIIDLISLLPDNILSKLKFLFVGNGEDLKKLQEKIESSNVSKYFIFAGLRTDVPQILSALDLFLLPSKYEGLPVVLVESQAAGLISLASDTITKEINITGNICYMNLEKKELWIEAIKKNLLKSLQVNRLEESKKMYQSKYDIKFQSKKLFEKYSLLIKGERDEH